MSNLCQMPFLFFWDCNLFNIYIHMECDWANYRPGNSWCLLHDTFGKNHALRVSRLLSTATSNAKWSRGRCLVNKFHGAGFTKISNVFEQLLGYDLFIFFPLKQRIYILQLPFLTVKQSRKTAGGPINMQIAER